jgi:hypothetical protein
MSRRQTLIRPKPQPEPPKVAATDVFDQLDEKFGIRLIGAHARQILGTCPEEIHHYGQRFVKAGWV